MSGREIDVFVEGENGPVGRLSSDDYGALTFRYSQTATRPLSLSLPLPADGGAERHGDAAARVYFDNLLPENASLDDVMARHGIDRSDVAGLLYHLGRDCSGAVSCVPAGEGPGKVPGRLGSDYDLLADEDLAAIIVSLRDRQRLPADTADPSPLAGVQGKIALARLPDGRFALPKPRSGVPTTHILKVPRRGEERLVDHEDRLMAVASRIYGAVARVAPLDVRGARGLLIERFDRVVEDDVVRRLHQEDFCQALGLSRRLKYERDSDGGPRAFTAVRVGELIGRTASPALARRSFLRATLLNLALGNTDNHGKNHALIYRVRTPELAPLYDIVPVLLDPNVRHDFSFRIGQAKEVAELTAGDLIAFAQDIGLRAEGRAARAQIRRMAQDLLVNVAAEIEGLGGPVFKLLGDMIADQVCRLAAAFDLEVAVPARDTFVLRGGGFGLAS